MSRFSIKPQQIRTLSDEEQRIAEQLRQCAGDLDDVKSSLRSQIKGLSGVGQGLINLSNQINEYSTKVSTCRSALISVADTYDKTETRILDNGEATFNLTDALSNMAVSVTHAMGTVIDGLAIHNIINKIGDYDINEIIDALKKFKDLNPGEAFSKWMEEQGIDISSIPVVSGITGSLSSWDDVKDFISDIPGAIKSAAQDYIVDETSFHEAISGGDSLYSNEISCENGSLSLDVGAYDYYADAEGHVFRIDDDGNMVFDPSISAAMGASFTALSVAGNYAIGSEYFGASANGEVTVGRIEGQASMGAGLYDESGHFNPNASLNASAEAVAVEAKGEIGGNVAGVEAKAKGSVYVGAGAHANVEVSGGKISVDVGAAIGIGASVGFEVDFSGVVNCVQDTCKSALSGLFGW